MLPSGHHNTSSCLCRIQVHHPSLLNPVYCLTAIRFYRFTFLSDYLSPLYGYNSRRPEPCGLGSASRGLWQPYLLKNSIGMQIATLVFILTYELYRKFN